MKFVGASAYELQDTIQLLGGALLFRRNIQEQRIMSMLFEIQEL